jgi:hypothetical protein
MAPVPLLPDSAVSLLRTAASTLHPTRTLPYLLNRQATTTSPTATVTVLTDTNGSANNDNNDPDGAKTLTGGAIAGIVIGSIAGFLILVWIIRSCTNLGAPPGDEAEPGRPWYGSVRDEYPPRHGHAAAAERRGRSRGRSHSREYHHHHGGYHHHHHHGHGGSRSRSRRVSVTEAVPVQEVAPVVVRSSREERRRSRSRGYYGYGEGPVRGRSGSRGRY